MMQKKLDKVNSNIQETLQNVRVIKFLCPQGIRRRAFFQINEDLKDSSLRAYKEGRLLRSASISCRVSHQSFHKCW